MNKTENLEGIVSKLKQQGIQAGENEKKQILESAQKEANKIIEQAEAERKKIIEDADQKAAQSMKNADISIKQASRDMVEATKIAIIKHLKTVFGKQCEKLFTEKQYLEILLKEVVSNVSGNKSVSITKDNIASMQDFLLKSSLNKEVELKPLPHSDAKIVVSSSEKEGMQFVLSAKDVEEGLFSLLNKDLVEQIKHTEED